METTCLTPKAKTIAVTSVRHLESQVFDDDGHLRRGVTREIAELTVARLNELRLSLGWLPVDLDGRWCWPA